jgi:hypothetical protein
MKRRTAVRLLNALILGAAGGALAAAVLAAKPRRRRSRRSRSLTSTLCPDISQASGPTF